MAKEPKEAASGLKPGLVQLSVSSLSGIRTPLPALSYQDAAGSRWLMPDLPASSGGQAGSGFGRQTVQKLRDRGSGRPLSSLSPAAPAQQRGTLFGVIHLRFIPNPVTLEHFSSEGTPFPTHTGLLEGLAESSSPPVSGHSFLIYKMGSVNFIWGSHAYRTSCQLPSWVHASKHNISQGALLSLDGPQNPFQHVTLGTIYLITVGIQDVINLPCLNQEIARDPSRLI